MSNKIDDALAAIDALQEEAGPIDVPGWVKDPVDREMIRRGYARAKLEHDDPFDLDSPVRRVIRDNPGAEDKRSGIKRSIENKSRGRRDASNKLDRAVPAAIGYMQAKGCSKRQACRVIAQRHDVNETSLYDRLKPSRK